MRYLLIVAILLISLPAMADDFVSVEYAPISNHLSDDDAPVGGYNEDNNIVTVKIGREYDWDTTDQWDYNLSIGITAFENSYDKSSFGAGVGAEAQYHFDSSLAAYGGADLGLVSGYEGNVNSDFVIFDELIPFLVLNAGLEYEFAPDLPSLRGGIKYVPASLVDSDDVIAYTIGTRYKF